MPLNKQLEKKIEAFYMDLTTFMFTRGNILSLSGLVLDDMAPLSALLAKREMIKATNVLCSNSDEQWIAGLYEAQNFLSRDNAADRLMLAVSDTLVYQKQEAQSRALLATVDELLTELQYIEENKMDAEEKPSYVPAFEQPDFEVPNSPWMDLEHECYDAQMLWMAYGKLSQHSPNLEQALDYEAQAFQQEERLIELTKRRTL